MAKLLKLRRGTTAQHASFTGAEGEVTIDTTKDTAVVHDGSTQGGTPLAKEDMSNVSSASIAGRLGTDSIAPSKIAAGSLPSDVTVDGTNINAGSIHNSDINTSAAIANSKLADSGVTAGAYGSSSAIPIVTVNAKGIVTAASTTAIDSTTIANGSSSVSVANNGAITSNANHDFSAGIDVTGNITATGDATITGGDLKLSGNFPRFLFEDVAGSDIDAYAVNNSNVLAFGKTNSPSTGNDILVLKLNDQSAQFKGNLDVDAGVDVTGNITVSGTVDGVDIAAFKTAFDQALPAGTKMLFAQTSAPTGWTKETTHNNKALRVVSGTAGSGGTNAFTNTLASRGINANAGNTTAGGNVSSSAGNTTAGGNISVSVANTTAGGNISVANTTAGGNVSISSVSTSGTVNGHTLSNSQAPSHSHSVGYNAGYANNRGGAGQGITFGRLQNSGLTGLNTNSQGGNGSHSHGFSGSSHNHNGSLSGTAHNHNASFSGSAHNHNANASFSGSAHNHNVSSSFTGTAHNHSISVGNLDMAVQYVDVIIASKN